jgi:CBS domain-containing protein
MAAGTTIKEILDHKGGRVFTLSPNALVFEAVRIMAENSVGSVVVLDNDEVVGILSEREYARQVILQGRSSKETEVRQIMATPVHYVVPDCRVDEAMRIMTDQRIRHLPVLDANRLIGIVSIGDLVRSIVDEQAAHIEHLSNYITGRYPG